MSIGGRAGDLDRNGLRAAPTSTMSDPRRRADADGEDYAPRIETARSGCSRTATAGLIVLEDRDGLLIFSSRSRPSISKGWAAAARLRRSDRDELRKVDLFTNAKMERNIGSIGAGFVEIGRRPSDTPVRHRRHGKDAGHRQRRSHKMRYLPHRRRPRRHAGDDRRRLSTSSSPTSRRQALKGRSTCRSARASSTSAPMRRLAEEPCGGRRAVLRRRRRLSASRAGERRPHHPALRVPHLLHALPAGNQRRARCNISSSSRRRSRTSPAWRSPTPPCTTARRRRPKRC